MIENGIYCSLINLDSSLNNEIRKKIATTNILRLAQLLCWKMENFLIYTKIKVWHLIQVLSFCFLNIIVFVQLFST